MSWSTSSTEVPPSGRRRTTSLSSAVSVGVEPGRRLVEEDELGPGDKRARQGDEVALPVGELGRRPVGDRRRGRAARGARRRSASCWVVATEHVGDRRHERSGVEPGGHEVLTHGQIVEQLERLERAGQAAARGRAAVRGRLSPSKVTRPNLPAAVKPVEASMQVVLPAPFGPMRPTTSPRPRSGRRRRAPRPRRGPRSARTSRSASPSGARPPRRRRRATRWSAPPVRPSRPARPHGATDGPTAAFCPDDPESLRRARHLPVPPLGRRVRVGSDAPARPPALRPTPETLRREDRGDDERDPAERARPTTRRPRWPPS